MNTCQEKLHWNMPVNCEVGRRRRRKKEQEENEQEENDDEEREEKDEEEDSVSILPFAWGGNRCAAQPPY
jgi:hypothetical protein